MKENINTILKTLDAAVEHNNYEKAIAQCDILTARFPDNPKFYALRGFLYSKTQQISDALRDYSTAISLELIN